MDLEYHCYVFALLLTSVAISCLWAYLLGKIPKIRTASILLIMANIAITLAAVALIVFPSLLYYEFRGLYTAHLGFQPIIANALAVIGGSLFRAGKLNLSPDKIGVMDKLELVSAPFMLVLVNVALVLYGYDTIMYFELTFSMVFSYIMYRTVVDIYASSDTTICNKFVQSLPFKLLILVQLLHLVSLIENKTHSTGDDEKQLMIEYIALLVAINSSIVFQIDRKLIKKFLLNKFYTFFNIK